MRATDRIHRRIASSYSCGRITRAIVLTKSFHFVSSRVRCFLPCRREAVELRSLVVLGCAPFGLDPALAPQAVKRGIQAAVFDLEEVVGLGADHLPDAVAVLRSPLQSPQDQQIQRPL